MVKFPDGLGWKWGILETGADGWQTFRPSPLYESEDEVLQEIYSLTLRDARKTTPNGIG
jgi:hypothetical protein